MEPIQLQQQRNQVEKQQAGVHLNPTWAPPPKLHLILTKEREHML